MDTQFQFNPARTTCQACGAPLGEKTLISVEDQVSVAGFTSQACSDCGSFHLDPQPTPDSLNSFYNKIGQDDWFIRASLRYYQDPKKRLEMKQRHFDPLLEHIQSGYLMDYGCGVGWLAKLAQDAGFSVAGLDVMAHAIEAGRTQLGLDPLRVGDERTLPDCPTFDAFVAQSCIEHMPDPKSLTARAYTALNPGGVLMYAFPSADSAMFELFEESSYLFMAPYHLTHFTKQGMAAMLADAGFVDIQFRPVQYTGRWAHALAKKKGFSQAYQRWREDPEFVKFDILMDGLFDELAHRADESCVQHVFARKPHA